MTPHWWASDLWHHSPALFVSWVFWVIFSIVLHELSHGWAALRAGDPTPRATGHMTWNPLVHMGGFSLIMFALVGICWGAMPVNPCNFRKRHDDAVVAAAGPAMNLGLGIVACLLAVAWVMWGPHNSLPGDLYDNLFRFFRIGAAVNLSLLILNLIPVPPLDGSRIVASFVPAYRQLMDSEKGPMLAMVGFIIIFYGVGGRTLTWAIDGADWIILNLLRAFNFTP